jgi:hypothetical protein
MRCDFLPMIGWISRSAERQLAKVSFTKSVLNTGKFRNFCIFILKFYVGVVPFFNDILTYKYKLCAGHHRFHDKIY